MEFNHSTRSQLATRLRERYRGARGFEAVTLAAWMTANLTDAELSTAFTIAPGQVAGLRARMAAHQQRLAAVRAAVGE